MIEERSLLTYHLRPNTLIEVASHTPLIAEVRSGGYI
jgi:hypothetical protein